MSVWHLHELAIAPDGTEPFLDLWRTRLVPLSERHGPRLVGCFLVRGDDRFVWFTRGDPAGKDDALAEDWPAILMRHEQLGTMDVSVPLRELAGTVAQNWLAERGDGGPDSYFELLEYWPIEGAADRLAEILTTSLIPLVADYGITVDGAWHGHDHYYLLIGFRDQADAGRRFSELRDDTRWPAYQSDEGQLLSDKRNRFLTICDFSPAGPVTTDA